MADTTTLRWSDVFLTQNPTSGPGWVHVRNLDNRHVAAVATVSKAIKCDDSAMMITSVISSPCLDIQGDVVSPDGWDLDYHRLNPTVLYDHGVDYKLPIGIAEDPGGKYTVRRAGDRLVADTYFAKNEFGEQCYDLAKQDILRGWSVTFDPTSPGVPLGPVNPHLRRPPMRFDGQRLIEYTLTPNPINPEALTILAEKGRAGAGVFHPVIQKSLSAYLRNSRPDSAVVPPHPLTLTPSRVGKAMSDDTMAGAGGDPGAEPMNSPTPTAQHAYDLSQALADVISHVEAGLTQGEHKRGKKKLKKLLDDLRGCQDEAKAVGDMVMSDLDDEGAEDAMVDDPEPVEKSAAGVILIRKARYEPKRWTAKDLAAAEGLAAPAVETEPRRKSRAEREAEKEAARKAAEEREIEAQYEANRKKYPDLFKVPA